MPTRLTKEQVAELRWFVEGGKRRAEDGIGRSKSVEERSFYERIVERADQLLPLLGSSKIDLPDEDNEETN